MRHCWGVLLLAAISALVLSEVSAILGGKLASQDTGLYQVSIFNRKHKHYCGGSIIRQNWIATASHCFGVCGEGLKCAVRYATRNKVNQGRTAPIRIFVSHPKHDPDVSALDSNYDVGLIEAPLILDQLAQPIPIGDVDVPLYGVMSTSGFGWIKNANNSCSLDLKSTELKRVKCPMLLAPTFICTLGVNTNPCHGDSGGPLTYKGKLVGVTGFGANIPSNEPPTQSLQSKPNFSPRCFPGAIGNFGYVYRFRDWINETITNFTLKYDLENLPPHKEWDDAYMDKEYGFNRSSVVYC